MSRDELGVPFELEVVPCDNCEKLFTRKDLTADLVCKFCIGPPTQATQERWAREVARVSHLAPDAKRLATMLEQLADALEKDFNSRDVPESEGSGVFACRVSDAAYTIRALFDL